MGSVELMVIDINWQDPNGVVNCMRKICAVSDFVADCVEATEEKTIGKIMQSSLRHFKEGSGVKLISAQIMYRGTEPVVFHSHGITCPKTPELEMLKFAYMTPDGESIIPWGLHGTIEHCGKHGDG